MSDTPVPSRLISTSTEDSLVARSMRAVRSAAVFDPVGLMVKDPLWEKKWFLAPSAALSSLGGKRSLARKDALQGGKEGCGFRLSTRSNPEVAGDSHVADEHTGVQQFLPYLVRILQAAEEHVVGVRCFRPEAHPGEFRDDTVTLLFDVLDICHQGFAVFEGGQGGCLGDGGQVVREANQPQGIGDL